VIAVLCGDFFMTMSLSPRAFVEKLPFVTSLGHGTGRGSREALGLSTKGPTKVITDLCVLEPDPDSRELAVVSLHPGVSRDEVQAACGWAVRFADEVAETQAPDPGELSVLRDLHARTARAHGDRS
jgi:glutaconate CoA-transferase subunit B